MMLRALARTAAILTALAVAGCSFSSGGSGGSSPGRTYVVLPNGNVAPAQTTNRPPGS